MVSICERSQAYTAHSPRGWQETVDGSSALSRLGAKAVVRQAWRWLFKWVVCCLVVYRLVEFMAKALNLVLVKSVSLLLFRLFLKFVSAHHILFVEEWYVEKHVSVIPVFYKLGTFTQCLSARSCVLTWVHWEEPEMGMQVPLGHRVWGSRKGRGRKEGRVGFRLEVTAAWSPPGALEHELQDRVSPTLRLGGMASCDLTSVTRSDWEGWEEPRQFSRERGNCELAASAHSSRGGGCPVPGKETRHQEFVPETGGKLWCLHGHTVGGSSTWESKAGSVLSCWVPRVILIHASGWQPLPGKTSGFSLYLLKETVYLRVFSLNYFYWVFITSVFTLPSKDEDEEADHKTEADPGRLDQMVHPMAERLDILLSLLLSYIKDVCYVDGNSLQ